MRKLILAAAALAITSTSAGAFFDPMAWHWANEHPYTGDGNSAQNRVPVIDKHGNQVGWYTYEKGIKFFPGEGPKANRPQKKREAKQRAKRERARKERGQRERKNR
jgi:hypothetical protein